MHASLGRPQPQVHPAGAAPPARRTEPPAGGVLRRNRRFRRLWAGQTVSLLGDQVTLLALPLVAVLALHASAAQMGILTALGWAPSLVAPLVGAWIDRRAHRRRMMIAADLGRAVAIATIPVSAAFGAMSMAHLYAVALATGGLSVLFDLSYGTYFLAVVDPADALEAQGRLSLSRSAAQVAGPGIGGFLVQILTAPVAVAADTVSFLASAMFLSRIDGSEPPLERAGERQPVWRRMAEGFRFLFGRPLLRAGLASATTLNLFTLMFTAIVILYASRELGLAPGLIGAALASGAAGGVVGALIAPRAGRRLGIGPAIMLGAVLFPAPLLLVPLAGGPTALVVATLAGAEFLASVGVMLFDVNIGTLIVLLIPYRLRARTSGAFRSINYGVRPFGALLGGFLGTAIGLRSTLVIAVAGAVTSVLWLWFSPMRSLRSPPAPAEADDR